MDKFSFLNAAHSQLIEDLYQQYLKYIYLDEIGQRIKPGYITQHFQIVLAKNNLRTESFSFCFN